MTNHRINRRLGAAAALVATVLLITTACEPLINPPPGGGDTVTQTFNYGPFTLGPDGELQGFPTSGMPRPTGAFGLKGARFNVVDENFVPVSAHDVHLHHIVMTTSARQDRLCPGRAERFIGAGMERTPITLWGPYTYLVGANDQWGSIWHLMNETQTTRTVYIQYALDYQPGANATNSRPVDAYFQDITGCGNSTYDVPGDGGPESMHVKSKSWPITQDGLVVFTGGHLHMGGINITLHEGTANNGFCSGIASYHQNPDHLASINPCQLHHRVRPGENFTVAARYDNSQPWTDVMGIMLTFVWWGTQE